MKSPKGVLHLRSRFLLVLLAAFLASAESVTAQRGAVAAAVEAFPTGTGLVDADFGGTVLQLYSYKPAGYTGERFILLLHGASRAAEAYRGNAAGMAEAFGALVVVPYFDEERFPSRLYQFGGVFREDGSLAAAEERIYAYVPRLADYIRDREGDDRLPYLLLGFGGLPDELSNDERIRRYLALPITVYIGPKPWSFARASPLAPVACHRRL